MVSAYHEQAVNLRLCILTLPSCCPVACNLPHSSSDSGQSEVFSLTVTPLLILPTFRLLMCHAYHGNIEGTVCCTFGHDLAPCNRTAVMIHN